MRHPSLLAQPASVVPGPVPAAPVSSGAGPERSPLPTLPRGGRTAPVWTFAVLLVLLIGVVAYILTYLGVVASAVGLVLALIPLAGVLWAVRIVDRWEPEPLSLVLFAIAWGAIVAVVIALGVDVALSVLFPAAADDPVRDALSSVVQAPLVEEFAKGLGVFLVFVFGRRTFDGPLDGVVYGALVGAGFAFTENILYFATSLIEGGVSDAAFTFFLRGILSPFAHVMFTALTGYALGLAARRGASTGNAAATGLVGVLCAAALHAVWNGSALFADFFHLYVTLQVPLFVAFVLGVRTLRREEERLTRARLGEFAAAGWFTVQEADLLATRAGRRRARSWARTLPGDRSQEMKAFIREATLLAAARERTRTGRDPGSVGDEQVHLARATAARSALLA